ncbi:MAG: lipoate--protein ligase [Bacteroidetes bacterium]|nr:lipoate--protein ligase [Bacteroidota bacterium]
MLCIYNTSIQPYFNLATEEYFIKNFEEDIFMLWRNSPSIIVGKHQNTLAEINLDYVNKNEIPVVRRLSGGGTVFHDLGNVNFTFIKKGEEGKLVDFKKYTQPIIDVLKEIGIDAKFEGRNDLTIKGKKFSGNAEHVWQNKVLHHGTLLFSANISSLTEALKVNPLKFTDKAVKSVRSRVTNISEHLNHPIDIIDFIELIMNYIKSLYSDSHLYKINEKDQQKIQQLADDKYSIWDWNFGYSPKYNFQKSVQTKGGNLDINLDVVKGKINQIKFYGDYFHRSETEEIEQALTGIIHQKEAISLALKSFEIENYFAGFSQDDLINGMF